MYDLSNTIFCPIGSALTKHLVASRIWTHNSKRLAYTHDIEYHAVFSCNMMSVMLALCASLQEHH